MRTTRRRPGKAQQFSQKVGRLKETTRGLMSVMGWKREPGNGHSKDLNENAITGRVGCLEVGTTAANPGLTLMEDTRLVVG